MTSGCVSIMGTRRWSPRVDLPQNSDFTDLTRLTELGGAGGAHRRGHGYSWVEITPVERDEVGDTDAANRAADPAAVERRKVRRSTRRAVKKAALEANAPRIEGTADGGGAVRP